MSPSSRLPARSVRADVVVVTGASRGVGLEVCKLFASLGSSVGMIARDSTALEEARGQIEGECYTAAADVSDRDALRTAFGAIEAALGPPSVLVNNAGHGQWSAVIDTEPAVFERAIEVNYLGAVYATGLVVEDMLGRGGGHIVNVVSIAGRIGAPFEAAYSASKFALVGYTEALAVELAGSGVTVSLVAPGPIDTEFFDRRGQPRAQRWPKAQAPEKVAEAVMEVTRRRRSERFIPRWLRATHAARTLLPPVYRFGARWMFATERRELRNRFR